MTPQWLKEVVGYIERPAFEFGVILIRMVLQITYTAPKIRLLPVHDHTKR